MLYFSLYNRKLLSKYLNLIFVCEYIHHMTYFLKQINVYFEKEKSNSS